MLIFSLSQSQDSPRICLEGIIAEKNKLDNSLLSLQGHAPNYQGSLRNMGKIRPSVLHLLVEIISLDTGFHYSGEAVSFTSLSSDSRSDPELDSTQSQETGKLERISENSFFF